MLFNLTLSQGAEIGNVALSALENLAQSAINGNHIVSGDRALLEKVASDVRLTSRSRSYYRRAAQGLTQLGRTINTFHGLIIDIGAEGFDVIDNIVPAGVFTNADYCEKTQLLVENLTDYEVLVGLARLLLSENYRGFAINVRAQNGGGSTTPQVLDHIMSTPSGPVLCIVDSDRKFSDGAIGSTAKSTKRAAKSVSEVWRMQLHVLPVRELENLVPKDLRTLCTQDLADNVRECLIAFDRVEVCYSDYCCLKNGDSRCRMLGDALSKKRFDLIETFGGILAGGLNSIPRCGTCPYPGGCFASPALGGGFLQKVARFLNSERAATSIADWREELRLLVEMVLQAGFALPQQRI